MATKENTIVKNLESVKANARKANANAIKFVDNIVDETIANSEEWQKVFAKVLKNGNTLFAKQQDMTLDTLEALKKQYFCGNSRMRKLFGFGLSPKPETVKKAVKSTTKKVEATVAKAEKSLKSATANAKKTVTKAAKAANQDLKSLNGIGPKMEKVLNTYGISSFADLAQADANALAGYLVEQNARYAMYDPKEWIAAAKKQLSKR